MNKTLLYIFAPLLCSTGANLSCRWAYFIAGAQWEPAAGLTTACIGGFIGLMVLFAHAMDKIGA